MLSSGVRYSFCEGNNNNKPKKTSIWVFSAWKYNLIFYGFQNVKSCTLALVHGNNKAKVTKHKKIIQKLLMELRLQVGYSFNSYLKDKCVHILG